MLFLFNFLKLVTSGKLIGTIVAILIIPALKMIAADVKSAMAIAGAFDNIDEKEAKGRLDMEDNQQCQT